MGRFSLTMCGEQDTLSFDASHLDIDFPRPVDQTAFPEIFIGLNIAFLSTGCGIVTDRYRAPAERPAAGDMMNQIERQLSPLMLSSWLRRGCEDVLQIAGATACHPAGADVDYENCGLYEPGVDSYHDHSACLTNSNDGCVIYELIDDDSLGASPHALFTNVSSQEDRQSDEQSRRKRLGESTEIWKLTLDTIKPEFVGLLAEAVSILDDKSPELTVDGEASSPVKLQITDTWLVNPLYSPDEARRLFRPQQHTTGTMDSKDDLWQVHYRDKFIESLQARLANRDADLPMPTQKEETA